MKIKCDFVTNSSSSAFIVFWPNEVKGEDDVGNFIQRDDYRKTIFHDIEKQTAMRIAMTKEVIDKIATELDHGYHPDVDVDYWDYRKVFCRKHGITEKDLRNNRAWSNQCYQENDEIKRQKCIKKATEIVEQYEGAYAYFFEYGDEDGQYFSGLEHHNNWGGLPYIRISHH